MALPRSNAFKRCRWNGKQCRPWSGHASRNTLIWVSTVCPDTFGHHGNKVLYVRIVRQFLVWPWSNKMYHVTSLVPSQIKLTFVTLRRGFKKASSVLFDTGDSWDKDFLNPITSGDICITGWCYRCLFVCLCWGLTSQSTIFQSCRDGATASWVINQYFWGVKCLAQGHNMAAVGFEPPTSRSGVRHSTTKPPCSPCYRCV